MVQCAGRVRINLSSPSRILPRRCFRSAAVLGLGTFDGGVAVTCSQAFRLDECLMIASPVPMRTSPWWLLLLTFIAYGGSLFGAFHPRRFRNLLRSGVHDSSGWWEVWRPQQTRPLTYFTFWVNYMIAGRHALGYHAVNLGLHLGAVWLAFRGAAKLNARPDCVVRRSDFRRPPDAIRSGELYFRSQHSPDVSVLPVVLQ